MKLNKRGEIGFFVLIFFAAWLASFEISLAADFNILPAAVSTGAGQEFSVDVKINSGGVSINAAQAVIKFSPAILQVKSILRDSSVFGFWLQEPVFSSTDGKIEFIGGTPNGVMGEALQAIRINFTAKSAGISELSFIDGAVSAADGSGANVLSKSNGAAITVASGTGGAAAPKVSILPTPAQIVRTPAPAAGLPVTPAVSISLYPESDKWYGFSAPFTVSWQLPPDITGVSMALSKNPHLETVKKSDGLFDSVLFPAFSEDGVYYFHIRFQNEKGWGKTVHRRIAVDTQPPLPFKFDIPSGFSSDEPAPRLLFRTGDALSGVDKYKISIDAEEPVFAGGDNEEYKILPHPPGTFLVTVTAIDKAGNAIEDKKELEILPILSPNITTVSRKIINDTGDVFRVGGTAAPDIKVLLYIIDGKKFLVSQNEVLADQNGNWSFQLEQELRSGNYAVTARAKDGRGALSLQTIPEKFSVKNKPVISLFGLDITLRGLLFLTLIAGASAAAYFWRRELAHRLRTQMSSVIVSRDLKNALEAMRDELGKLSGILKKKTGTAEEGIEFKTVLNKLNSQIEKLEKYVSRDIEKLE